MKGDWSPVNADNYLKSKKAPQSKLVRLID
jgi:hypothetical protein